MYSYRVHFIIDSMCPRGSIRSDLVHAVKRRQNFCFLITDWLNVECVSWMKHRHSRTYEQIAKMPIFFHCIFANLKDSICFLCQSNIVQVLSYEILSMNWRDSKYIVWTLECVLLISFFFNGAKFQIRKLKDCSVQVTAFRVHLFLIF